MSGQIVISIPPESINDQNGATATAPHSRQNARKGVAFQKKMHEIRCCNKVCDKSQTSS